MNEGLQIIVWEYVLAYGEHLLNGWVGLVDEFNYAFRGQSHDPVNDLIQGYILADCQVVHECKADDCIGVASFLQSLRSAPFQP